MNYQQWQNDFDQKKWMDSIIAGEDTCGSYEFCAKCNKEQSTPCARAFQRFDSPRIKVAVLRPRV